MHGKVLSTRILSWHSVLLAEFGGKVTADFNRCSRQEAEGSKQQPEGGRQETVTDFLIRTYTARRPNVKGGSEKGVIEKS